MATNGGKLDTKTVITAIVSGAFGMLITFVTGVSTQAKDIATLSVKVDQLTKEIRTGMEDRYRASDTIQDFGNMKDLIKNINRRDDKIETRLNDHVKNS